MMTKRDPAPVVFLDATVLWGSLTTDLVMALEDAKLISPRWSHAVIEEARRTVKKRKPHARVDHRLDSLMRFLPAALVRGHESLIPSMPADQGDKHVLAAAMYAESHVLISDNVPDFHHESADFAIEVMSIDHFLRAMLQRDSQRSVRALEVMTARHSHPPRTLRELVGMTGKSENLHGFAIDLNRSLPPPHRVPEVPTRPPRPMSPAAQRFAARRPPLGRRRGPSLER